MRRLLYTCAMAAAAVCARDLRAQNLGDFYVDGLIGQDIPANGSSPGTPWKTITYALATIPPVSNASTWYTLFVEGNQVYSPATNGDTLPIRPAYNVSIEGTFVGHGQLPVIKAASGGTCIEFAPSVTFNRNQVTLRYLVLDGGSYGVRMGANPGARHRPRIQDCVFRGQGSANLQIRDLGNAIADPRFFQNTFTGAPRALEILAASSGSIIQPDVEENTFTGASAEAIFLDDTSVGGGNVGGSFRSNWFADCARGIHVRVGRFAASTNFTVFSSSFARMQQEAVWIEIQQSVDPAASISLCSFVNCGTGLRFSGTLGGGTYSVTLDDNFARDCATGFLTSLGGSGSVALLSTGNLAQGCKTGFWIETTNTSPQLTWRSQGDRALRGAGGFTILGAAPGSSFSILSAMACGNSGAGITLSGSVPTTVRSTTLADDATGLMTTSSATTLDHLVFAGNTVNVGGLAPPISYSCFQGSSWPGTGNLSNTDPQLVRPFYKLAPSSPCIDKGNIAYALPATDYEGDPRASVSRSGGQPLPDLGADEYVQLGSVRKYGVRGFGGFNFFPEIGSPSVHAIIGGNLQVDLFGAILPVFGLPATSATLTMGLRDDSGSFPADLGFLGAPGSLLWNDLTVVLGPFNVSATGTASAMFPIPPLGILIGETFTFQWWAFLPQANAAGVATSDGLRVTIGQ